MLQKVLFQMNAVLFKSLFIKESFDSGFYKDIKQQLIMRNIILSQTLKTEAMTAEKPALPPQELI